MATATSRAWVSTASTFCTVSAVSRGSSLRAVATSAANAASSRGGPPAAAISSSAAASTQSATRSGISPSGLNCSASRVRGDSVLTTCRAGEPATSTSSRRAPRQVSRLASASVGTTRTPTVSPSSTSAGIGRDHVGAALHLDGARQGAELPRGQPRALDVRRGRGPGSPAPSGRPGPSGRRGPCRWPAAAAGRRARGRWRAGGRAPGPGPRRPAGSSPRSPGAAPVPAPAAAAPPGRCAGAPRGPGRGSGTRPRRSCLGSVRSSAVTSSSRRPGTVKASDSPDVAAATPSSTASGTSTVTPSSAAPGANA